MTFTSLHANGVLFLVLLFMLPRTCRAFQVSMPRIDATVVMRAPVVTPRSHSDAVMSRTRFSSSSATTATTATTLFLFGNMLGHDASKVRLDEPITVYKNTTTSGDNNNLELEGLGDYVTQWANLLTNGGISLTTPVVVKPLPSTESSRGVQLLFRDTRTGYKSHKEDSAAEKDATIGKDNNDNNQNKKPKKEGKVKQGGVEIVVHKKMNGDGSSSTIEVVATRCEIDEDTIIKEMSEETIMHELRKAVEVWKRETK